MPFCRKYRLYAHLHYGEQHKVTDVIRRLLLITVALCATHEKTALSLSDDLTYYGSQSAGLSYYGPQSAGLNNLKETFKSPTYPAYSRAGVRKEVYRREDHTAGVLSVESFAKTYLMKIERDEILDTYTLSNQHDRVVFVPNMGRFELNGISLMLPIRPFYQGDRLYVPVEAVNFLKSPLPNYDQIPFVIRKRLKTSKVYLKSVFIDAGHGGHDPGTIGLRGTREKDVNLDIALRLAKLLNEQGVKTVLCRDQDFFVELADRESQGAGSGADVFISLHTNSSSDQSVAGIETFHNGVKSASNRLAETIQTVLAQNLGVPDRGVKTANFAVLRGNPLPAVLVEVGFLSNPDNESLLRQAFYRDRIASILVEALAAYSRGGSWR